MPNISEWTSTAERNFYPFVEGCVDAVRDLFSDLHLVVPHGTSGAFLSVLGLEGKVLSGTFLSTTDGSGLGSFAIDLNGSSFQGPVTNNDGAVTGLVVLSAAAFQSGVPVTAGQMRLTSVTGGVHPTCLVPVTLRVARSFIFPAGSVRGRVHLVEGDGIKLVKLSDSKLRIDAVGSSQKSDLCCEDDGVFLKGINDATPDSQGNIGVNLHPFDEPSAPNSPVQMLRIETSSATITFSLSQ